MFGFPELHKFPFMKVGPLADILKSKTGYKIEMELPGIKAEDIEIGCNNGLLEVKATRKKPTLEDIVKSHSERQRGTISRSFNLPSSADVTKIDATLSDGVLVLNIPKTESSKIEIKVQ